MKYVYNKHRTKCAAAIVVESLRMVQISKLHNSTAITLTYQYALVQSAAQTESKYCRKDHHPSGKTMLYAIVKISALTHAPQSRNKNEKTMSEKH